MEFKWFGVKEVAAKIKRLSAPELTNEIEQTTKKATLYVFGKIPPYPAPVGNYKRTGTLGRELNQKVESMGSNIVGKIGSPTPYAPWVISTERAHGAGPQAKAHRGRWYTLQGHLKKYQSDINRFFENMIKRIIR